MAFTRMTASVENVSALANKPNVEGTPPLNPDQLKAVFDKAGVDIQDYINNTLLDEMEADGAENIGVTEITGVNGDTVQDALEDLKSQLDGVSQGSVPVGSITTEKLAALAVTTQKIAELAVTEAKIAAGAVTGEKLAAGSVAEGKIANGAVTGQKIAAAAVTTEKMGQGAVTGEKTNFSAGLPVTGPLVLTSGVGYGDSLPSSGVEGQLFFLKV